MKRAKIITQLESELAAADKALADENVSWADVDEPEFYSGYWQGRRVGLLNTLTLLKGHEL